MTFMNNNGHCERCSTYCDRSVIEIDDHECLVCEPCKISWEGKVKELFGMWVRNSQERSKP